ncbi:hypothetical protein F5Y10DRAFT_273249 [Nemania abortiva]|nr:hypothetical protein F5Y10DRAFT_273249 [Nemania abortiva]
MARLEDYNSTLALQGISDLIIDDVGDIRFTDTDYAYILVVSDSPMRQQLVTWRFRSSTGQIQVMDNSLAFANGIAFSRDGKTLHITESELESYSDIPTRGTGNFYNYPINIQFNGTGARNVCAWNVAWQGHDHTHAVITWKRVIFRTLDGAPEGLKVAANKYLVIGGGRAPGVDITDELGN